jgi:hypothetical protein
MRRGSLVLFGSVLALLFTVGRAQAKCDPVADAATITAARAFVAANCDCATAPNHGTYVKCSAQNLKTFFAANPTANKTCKGQIQKCAAKSNCGKPGFVTCCKTNAKGKTTCSVPKDAAHCKAPRNGSACVSSFASCCDACTTSGCASPSGAFIDGLNVGF